MTSFLKLFSLVLVFPYLKEADAVLISKVDMFAITANNVVGTIARMPKSYEIKFEFRITAFQPSYSSILHVTIGGGYGVYGDRNPAVYIYGQRLVVASAINGDINFVMYHTEAIKLNEWYKLRIQQHLVDGTYKFEIELNDKSVYTIINNDAQEFANVLVYAGGKWNKAQAGSIKNLFINEAYPSPSHIGPLILEKSELSCGETTKVKVEFYIGHHSETNLTFKPVDFDDRRHITSLLFIPSGEHANLPADVKPIHVDTLTVGFKRNIHESNESQNFSYHLKAGSIENGESKLMGILLLESSTEQIKLLIQKLSVKRNQRESNVMLDLSGQSSTNRNCRRGKDLRVNLQNVGNVDVTDVWIRVNYISDTFNYATATYLILNDPDGYPANVTATTTTANELSTSVHFERVRVGANIVLWIGSPPHYTQYLSVRVELTYQGHKNDAPVNRSVSKMNYFGQGYTIRPVRLVADYIAMLVVDGRLLVCYWSYFRDRNRCEIHTWVRRREVAKLPSHLLQPICFDENTSKYYFDDKKYAKHSYDYETNTAHRLHSSEDVKCTHHVLDFITARSLHAGEWQFSKVLHTDGQNSLLSFNRRALRIFKDGAYVDVLIWPRMGGEN